MLLRAFGLRPRLLAALLLTSAVTLGVAALTLLSPLETRLRSDSVNTVLTAVTLLSPKFQSIPIDATGAPNTVKLALDIAQLERRSGATAFVVSASMQSLLGTTIDPELRGDLADVREALATRRVNHDVIDGNLEVAAAVHVGGPHGPWIGLGLRRRLNYVSEADHVVGNAFFTAALAGLGTALLLGLALTSTLLRRLERLRNSTRDLAREGLDATIPQDGSRDEIGELARAFASMQLRLRRQEAARRSFVATASHELRTPLASLDGMLELLEDDLAADHLDIEDARERTARAREQSRRLSRLAADLLDLSRLDADVELRSEPIELGEMSRAVAAEFELRAAASDVAVQLQAHDGPAWVAADPGALARIVRILLDNALRVAPDHTEVSMSIDSGKRWAALAVQDDGAGVPEQDRERIFERFQRGSNNGSGRGGFGLGLAIGRELATRMGGSLELESRRGADADASCGARFVLRLPIAELSEDER
ncbi:MAG TPA: HAMP domain-containing sensor histidine kinase [Solirubrobacteraceae bacterium]|nr:HAMP domain-containing sensor histidine kinase [Solirubrobacteraceae bacterium]